MFLYDTISFDDFLNAFKRMGRENQFSYEGKQAIFDYLESLAEGTGEPIELDVIGICCEFMEYDSIAELLDELFSDYVAEWEQGELTIDGVRELIERETGIVSFDVDDQGRGSIVIHQF